MGLEAVLEEIRNQGQSEAADVTAEAAKQAAAILAEADKEAAAASQRVDKETESRVAALERELLGASEFEARRRELATRRELLDDFRSRVLDGLSTLPAADRKAVLDSLVKRAQEEVPKGRVHGPKADVEHAAGSQGFSKGEVRDGAGGFVVESPDGDVLLDLRFETLLDDMWRQVLVACRELFEVE